MAQSINTGTKMEIQNVTLNAVTDTEITFTAKPNNILIRNRTTGDLQLRLSDNASDYFTIPDTQAITIDVGSKVYNPIWLRAVSGTPVAEILASFD